MHGVAGKNRLLRIPARGERFGSTTFFFQSQTEVRTITLWKLSTREVKTVKWLPSAKPPTLKIPAVEKTGQSLILNIPKKSYRIPGNGDINSLSSNTDGENFLSADDLVIKLWNIERMESYNILDITPPNLKDLEVVINFASFHPIMCYILLYGCSDGSLKVFDMRESARVRDNVSGMRFLSHLFFEC